jgi:ABC-type amino acid transport substrate-binding protein
VNKKLNLILTAGLFLSFLLITSAHADTSAALLKKTELGDQKHIELKPSKYTIVTENFPPFNYVKKGKLTGISTDIMMEILKRLNMENIPTNVMDWDKAYHTALEKPNTIIYSLTKIKQRKNKFKWVGPIATNYWYLFSKKQSDSAKKNTEITVKNLQEAKKYTIGVQDQGAVYLYLKSKGFKKFIQSVTNKECAENFLNGKVQLWGESELVAASLLKQINRHPNILQKKYKLRKHNLYIGFNVKTSDSIVKKFQTALDRMKNDGTYDKIINKYYNQIYSELNE